MKFVIYKYTNMYIHIIWLYNILYNIIYIYTHTVRVFHDVYVWIYVCHRCKFMCCNTILYVYVQHQELTPPWVLKHYPGEVVHESRHSCSHRTGVTRKSKSWHSRSNLYLTTWCNLIDDLMLARIGCLILFFSAALAFWRLTVSYHILQYLATSHRVFLYLIGSIQILRCTQHHPSVLFQPDIDMPQELNPWQTYDTS